MMPSPWLLAYALLALLAFASLGRHLEEKLAEEPDARYVWVRWGLVAAIALVWPVLFIPAVIVAMIQDVTR